MSGSPANTRFLESSTRVPILAVPGSAAPPSRPLDTDPIATSVIWREVRRALSARTSTGGMVNVPARLGETEKLSTNPDHVRPLIH